MSLIIKDGYIEGPTYNKELILWQNGALRLHTSGPYDPPIGMVYVVVYTYSTHQSAFLLQDEKNYEEAIMSEYYTSLWLIDKEQVNAN